MSNVVVMNTQRRPLHLVAEGQRVELLPGLPTQVDAAWLELAAKNSVIRAMIEEEWLTVSGRLATEAHSPAPDPIESEGQERTEAASKPARVRGKGARDDA